MTADERFGDQLREWRNRRRLSQGALGGMVGSDGPRIHRLEKGHENPTLETIDKLAAALEIDVSEFFQRPRSEQEPERARRAERNPLLASRWEAMLEALDAEVPAAETWKGDILKAMAALNRALRRDDDTGQTSEVSSTPRR